MKGLIEKNAILANYLRERIDNAEYVEEIVLEVIKKNTDNTKDLYRYMNIALAVEKLLVSFMHDKYFVPKNLSAKKLPTGWEIDDIGKGTIYEHEEELKKIDDIDNDELV